MYLSAPYKIYLSCDTSSTLAEDVFKQCLKTSSAKVDEISQER